jgi:YD repeat-containing protein
VDNAGTPTGPRLVLNYGYDNVGNVTSTTDNSGVTVASSFDVRDLLTRRTWSGGGVAPAAVAMSYDAAGERVGVNRFRNLAGTQGVAQTVEGYDAVGRLTQRTTTLVHGRPRGLRAVQHAKSPMGETRYDRSLR